MLGHFIWINKIRKKYLIFLFMFAFLTSYIASPLSYFVVYFKEPLTVNEYIQYLDDNVIDPSKHMVYVMRRPVQSVEEIYYIDGISKDERNISDTVFNTRPYALKALFDRRVRDWRLAGPENPYD